MPLKYLILLLILAPLKSIAKYENLFHKSYAKRYRSIDSLFYYNTPLRLDKNAFFNEIDRLSTEAENVDDIELVCEAKLLSLAFNSTSSKYPAYDKVEPEAYTLIAYAQKKKLIQIEIRCRQFLGRYYMEKAGKYLESIDQFLTSYYLLQHVTLDEFPNKKEHLYNVAHAYYVFGDYPSAKKYMREAENTPMPDGMTMLDDKNKIFTYISLENTLGLIYRNEKSYDTAINYFKTVHQLAARHQDSVWMGIAQGNIGITYYLQKNYDMAVPLLMEDIYQCFKSEQYDNGENSLIKLADIYLQKKDYKMTASLIDSAKKILVHTSEPSQHMQYLAIVMAQYYYATGKPALAYAYMDTARAAKEVIDTKKNLKALAIEEQKMQLQKHREELQKAENDKQFQILQRNSILAGVVFIASIFLLVIYGQKRRLKQKNILSEAEKLRAEQDLQNATSQLLEFTNSIREKNELIEKITTEIERYQSIHVEDKVVQSNEIITELQRSILLTDEQWEHFKVNFEKVHSGYLLRLKQKLPDLTPAETRFMVLAKLKLSNKEMAGMLGVSMQGVRNYRYRLRKKLSLPEEGSIDDLVNMV